MAVQTDVITLGESQGIMEGLEQHGQHQHLAVEDKIQLHPRPVYRYTRGQTNQRYGAEIRRDGTLQRLYHGAPLG
jgi:hypothetical protein